jgi:uncharacterized Zn-binding protein involved in type VI secretion
LPKPAARIGDEHMCPKVTPGTPPVPHVGGPVFSGCLTVLIEDRPAARVKDSCTCIGVQDKIITGSSSVYIGGKPAARMGDQTGHGGKIVAGSRTVMIGGPTVCIPFKNPDKHEAGPKGKDAYVQPSEEEKVIIINQAIQECIVLLEQKLILMENNDFATMTSFKEWFGRIDANAVDMILNRTKRALLVSKILTTDNFKAISDEFTRKRYFALVDSDDEFYTFLLGDLFWKGAKIGAKSMGGVLVHELSHFDDIGHTLDFDYGIEQCLFLAENYPNRALYNAENYEYFIKA